jgi:outer membrane lipoprotein-sorting protein
MYRKIIYLFVISILGINFSFAQSSAQELLKNIRDNFISIEDLSADIIHSVNGNVNLKGKVYFKKENNLRFEFKNSVIISDGKTSWNYNEKENKVVVTDYDSEGNKIFSINQLLFEYPEECELSTFESEGKKVLQLIPKTDSFSFNSVKLFLNDDFLITKVLVDEASAGNIQITISNYKLNTKLPDSYFSFSPPEGCQVIDLR